MYQGAEHEFQVLSDHGYAVVYTNPRGSVGYGEDFSGIIQGKWGDRDYKDLMEAMDHIIENFDYVDGDRLGVCGGSYAGYMTNWIVGQTDRFKASIAMRSISNWISMSGNSCVAFELGYPQHDISGGKPMWEDFQHLWDMSPLKYVANVKHPHMFIVSEGDHRCPMGQAEEMFTALKQMMRVTEIIRIPNEGHGVSRDGSPSHRVERLRHIVRWFDRYLN
jgi:dipeptidyl aminopeptidase/acylaminoacyl peptidase